MAAAVNAAGRYRMEKKMKIDSLIFDLDGTLLNILEYNVTLLVSKLLIKLVLHLLMKYSLTLLEKSSLNMNQHKEQYKASRTYYMVIRRNHLLSCLEAYSL